MKSSWIWDFLTQQMRKNENDVMFAELLVKKGTEPEPYDVCFEGVETEELRDYLKRFGGKVRKCCCRVTVSISRLSLRSSRASTARVNRIREM